MSTPARLIVIDTSVAIKWFRQAQEADVDSARDLRDQHLEGSIRICGPSLMLWELANVLKNKPDFSQSDTGRAIESIVNLEVQFFEPSPSLLNRAIEIAYSAAISLYDAAFVALAAELGCSLITSDRRLVEKTNLPFVRTLADM